MPICAPTGTIKYWYQHVCKIKWSHSCYDHYNGQHFMHFSNKAVKLLLTLKHIRMVHVYQMRATCTLQVHAHAPCVVRHSWQNFCPNCLTRTCAHTYVHTYVRTRHIYLRYNNIESVTLMYVHRMSQSEKETVGCKLLHT